MVCDHLLYRVVKLISQVLEIILCRPDRVRKVVQNHFNFNHIVFLTLRQHCLDQFYVKVVATFFSYAVTYHDVKGFLGIELVMHVKDSYVKVLVDLDVKSHDIIERFAELALLVFIILSEKVLKYSFINMLVQKPVHMPRQSLKLLRVFLNKLLMPHREHVILLLAL